jgi:ParB family chromosome partitioning protein
VNVAVDRKKTGKPATSQASTRAGSGSKSRGQRSPSALGGGRVEASQTTGEAIELLIENVEEDPGQPRHSFEERAMTELTESIALHGVKVPVAVHHHPDIPGRYIIDDGARRFRCSIRAGKKSIPAVVGQAFTLIEQLVVNKVRDDTPAKDKARAFARIMKERGWTQRQLAENSKLSEAYLSQHMTLLKLPPLIDEVFASGRCTDVTVINELAKAYKRRSDAVEAWLADDSQEITRGSVKLLREFLNDERQQEHQTDDEPSSPVFSAVDSDDIDELTTTTPSEKRSDRSKARKVIVLGAYKRRAVRLLTHRRWSADGLAWIRFEDSGEEIEIPIDQLKLRRLTEA